MVMLVPIHIYDKKLGIENLFFAGTQESQKLTSFHECSSLIKKILENI